MTQIPPIEPLTTPEFKRMLQQCIHCGLCLEACPTYSVFGTEMDAPRGRIAMMHAASSGRIGLTDSFQDHITLCLACRACETACPSGVQYGNLVEVVRNTIEKQRSPGLFESLLRWLSLRHCSPAWTFTVSRSGRALLPGIRFTAPRPYFELSAFPAENDGEPITNDLHELSQLP